MKPRGFTLLEVVVALAILGISLMVLLSTQAASMRNTQKVRDLTIATLLARSKMIDLEQELFDEGFTAGDQEDDGDFSEEGYKEIKWQAKITEVELTLDSLGDMMEGFADETDSDADDSADDMLASLGPIEGFMGEIGNSVRFIELTVTWPVDSRGKYHDSMSVSALVTREDYGIQAPDMLREAAEAGGIDLDKLDLGDLK